MDLKILIVKYKKAILQLLDDVAQEKNYNNQHSIVSYVNSTNVDWANDAMIYIRWRDNVYEEALFIMNELLSGERRAPTVEDFLSELPLIDWII